MKVTPSAGLTINYTGTFDLNKLLSTTKAFLLKRKYDYQEKEFQDLTSSSAPRELKITWDAEREINDFYKYTIVVFMLFEKLEQMDKNLFYTPKATIKVHGTLIADYQDLWEASKLKSKLFPIYLNSIIKNQMEDQLVDIKNESAELHKVVKKSLGLKT